MYCRTQSHLLPMLKNLNNFYTDPNHTNLIVNVHICCLTLLTTIVVNYGCLETNHDCVNSIIELLLCKACKYHYNFFFREKTFHVEVKITRKRNEQIDISFCDYYNKFGLQYI